MKWEDLKGKRLLITDKITEIGRDEWTLLEISPSGDIGKFRNELSRDCVFWNDLKELKLVEVLPDLVTTPPPQPPGE